MGNNELGNRRMIDNLDWTLDVSEAKDLIADLRKGRLGDSH